MALGFLGGCATPRPSKSFYDEYRMEVYLKYGKLLHLAADGNFAGVQGIFDASHDRGLWEKSKAELYSATLHFLIEVIGPKQFVDDLLKQSPATQQSVMKYCFADTPELHARLSKAGLLNIR